MYSSIYLTKSKQAVACNCLYIQMTNLKCPICTVLMHIYIYTVCTVLMHININIYCIDAYTVYIFMYCTYAYIHIQYMYCTYAYIQLYIYSRISMY